MINATTVSSPFEIVTERSAASGVQMHDSGAPKFGSVLDNKIKDQKYHTLEAKEDQPEKVQDRPEPKVIAKDDSKAKLKDEPQVEATEEPKADAVQTDPKADPKAEAKAEIDPQPKPEQTAENSKNAQAATVEATVQTPNAQAAIPMQQPAADVMASAELTQTAPDQVVVQTDTQSTVPAIERGVESGKWKAESPEVQTDTQTATPVKTASGDGFPGRSIKTASGDGFPGRSSEQTAVNAQAPKVEQVSTTNAQAQAVSEMEAVDTMGQNAATTVNLPIIDAKAKDKSDAKPTESSNTKTTFFGLSAKTTEQGSAGASPSQSEKNPGQNTSSENQTKNGMLLLAGKRHESERPFAQGANVETNVPIPGAMPAKAETPVPIISGKAPLDISGNMTFSPQVIKAITGDIASQIGVPEASVSSATNENQTANTASSTGDTQNAAIAMPVRSSFDNMVKGLDAAQKPEASTSSNTELQTKIIDQLVREVKLRQFQGQSDLTVKLNPPELGQIRLQITQTANGLTTQINASSEVVRGLLQAHIPALTNALADAGLKMDQVSVTSETSFDLLMQDNTSDTAYQQRNKTRQQHSDNPQNMTVHPAMINAAGVLRQALDGAAGSVGYSWLA
ncbi:MAG: flagellar hook-length control protein FliK [Armatimonadetes bacterium]|nr:flagellar hook-length control protein FliK [Armatimonadota bacterium]